MSKIFTWLDGKKMYIGFALEGVVIVGRSVSPEYEPIWNYVQRLADLMTGVGLAHKAVKATAQIADSKK
jgi:hypothetical protein